MLAERISYLKFKQDTDGAADLSWAADMTSTLAGKVLTAVAGDMELTEVESAYARAASKSLYKLSHTQLFSPCEHPTCIMSSYHLGKHAWMLPIIHGGNQQLAVWL